MIWFRSWPVAAVVAIVAFRFARLLRTDPVLLSDARIRAELRNIFMVASVCFAANAIWMCVLFAHLDGARRGDMAVLGGLAAIGACSGLSSFPAAARVPLATLAVPCSVALLVQSSAGHLVVGLGLLVLTLIKFRMLSVTDGPPERWIVRPERPYLALHLRAEDEQGTALAHIVEEIPVVVVHFEVSPPGAQGHLAADLIIDARHALPRQVGAERDAA